MTLRILKTIIVLFLFFPSSLVLAVEHLDVVINEIAWMGTENSYSDEWIELFNNSASDLSLEGWKLTAEDGSPLINLTGEITAGEFFLSERTNDESVLGIKADLIYKGNLNNKGECLYLTTKDGKIIDRVDCSSGWFAGSNNTKQTMERKNLSSSGNDQENWQTSQNPGGTPKEESSRGEKESKFEEKATTRLEEKIVIYPSNIFINEILPSPEGSDAKNEWVEIFNQNCFEVDLSNWRITDTVGKTKTYTFPEGTVIKAEGFLVLSRLVTKIILNNNQDSLNLLQPNGVIIDEASYKKAPLNKSFNRTDSGWVWSLNLTPESLNIISSSLSSKQESSEEKSEDASLKNDFSSGPEENKKIATISKQSPGFSNFSFVLLIALAVAFSSGIIILLLKKRLLYPLRFSK